MCSDIAIRATNLGKTYRMYAHPLARLRQMILPGGKKHYTEFHAIQDVNFEIKKGETVGIIGRNGSGKSTLLQLICGILKPTTGSVEVNGRVSALLELGAGFHPEFTGRENVYMQGAIMGLTREEMDARFDDIAAFADIGDFIEQPVKTYSSGMSVRLAFAVAISVDPAILVIDEALAVGDTAFQVKCMNRMQELAGSGVTMFFVSHNNYQVQRLCHRAIYLSEGALRMQGHPFKVIARYESDIAGKICPVRKEAALNPVFRFVAVQCECMDEDIDPLSPVIPEGRTFSLLIRYALAETLAKGLQFGVLLKCVDGTRIFGEMSKSANVNLSVRTGEHEVYVRFSPNLLLPGTYSYSFSAFDTDYVEQYGFIENALMLRIEYSQSNPLQRIGSVALPCEWAAAS